MGILKKKMGKAFQFVVNTVMGNGLIQDSNTATGERYVTPGLPALVRQAGAEAAVLLENDGTLPFKKGEKIAVFGRCQTDWFYVGYGSGGDVKAPYKVSFLDAAKEAEENGEVVLDKTVLKTYEDWRADKHNEPDDGWWGHWPMCYDEMPFEADFAKTAAKTNDVAVVIIGRAAGEDRESKLEAGSYYLTLDEIKMLDMVTAAFAKTVVIMDCGNVMDMKWTEQYTGKISSILYAWQGGMESCNAVWDVLTGKVNPSGKLADTIADTYADYPSSKYFGNREYNEYVEDIFVGYRYFETFAKDKAKYPFGFGLSYTTFDMSFKNFEKSADGVKVDVEVKNTGDRVGKEVVQAYVAAPQGKLGKAARVLVAFAKTDEIAPGKTQIVSLEFKDYDFASFDDKGSIEKHAYVLEKGEYSVYVGNSVRAEKVAGKFTLEKDVVLEKRNGVCGVQKDFERIIAVEKDGVVEMGKDAVPKIDYDLKARILANMPKTAKGVKGTYADVKAGKISAEQFVAALSNEELEALSRGFGCMNAPQGTAGNAGVYGGVIDSLVQKGVPTATCTDGPAGIRISYYASLMPCGTAQASTWNAPLVKALYAKVGEEMEHYKTDVILGAGMNIHRNPLCGRNFEYFSEDPFLTGKMAAAFVDGIQGQGKGACPKHFACNNQETNRNYSDSRLSERALREIYLKGFEICVKDAKPVNLMTSYNKINGVWAHYNYDTATEVLRNEWGFEGTVITDWWMRKCVSPEFASIRNNAYRVRAGVDVYMPGNRGHLLKKYISDGTLLESMGKDGGMTRGELERTAARTIRTLVRLNK